MLKIWTFTFIIISVVFQSQVHLAKSQVLQKRLLKLNNHVGTLSSAVTLHSFAAKFVNTDTLQERTLDSIMNEIRILNSNLKYTFTQIAEKISDLPNVIQYLMDNNSIIKHISRVGEIFRLTIRKKKQIDDGLQESLETLKLFKQGFNRLLEDSIIEIRRIFTGQDTLTLLTENYSSAVKKYATVCKTNMSEIQILDHILGLVRTVYTQYYKTKITMLELTKSKDSDVEDEKEVLMRDITSDYQSIVKVFKIAMSNASKAFWKCDPRIGTDSTYYELHQFSRYISENNSGKECDSNVVPILNKEQCRPNDYRSTCRLTRPCGLGYLDCNRLRPAHDTRDLQMEGFYVCYNTNETAISRYHVIETNTLDIEEDYKCKVGKFQYPYYAKYKYEFCDCLCHEKKYYFDESEVMSDYTDSRIVTGARLAVEDDIIYIQIQEAKILSNGKIEEGSLQWLTKQEKKRMNPSDDKHLLESVDLTEIKELPTDKVIVGFKLVQSSQTKRVKLGILLANYNFKQGKVWTSNGKPQLMVPEDASNEFELVDQKVPTKGDEEAKPISNNKQYVSFTITGNLEDGGQTTIPFIDTQKVETIRPTPLSGAGLYLKGQPKYGGFIGLKLYTYDVEPYVE